MMFRTFPLFISILLSLTILSEKIEAQNVSGLIYLENGQIVECKEILRIYGLIEESNRSNNNGIFKIIYNNSIRIIPLTDLKYIRIKQYSINSNNSDFQIISNIKLQVETKRKLSFETPYHELYWISAKISDEFQGENVDEVILFTKENRLNIRMIVFD